MSQSLLDVAVVSCKHACLCNHKTLCTCTAISPHILEPEDLDNPPALSVSEHFAGSRVSITKQDKKLFFYLTLTV